MTAATAVATTKPARIPGQPAGEGYRGTAARDKPAGGALVTTSGEVTGIPTLTAAGAQGSAQVQGIGFAIPSNLARDIACQLITAGKVTSSHRAAVGAQVGTVTGQDGAPAGTGIVAVTAGSPAGHAGLRPGDVIRAAGGTATDDMAVAGPG
jgi:S1-C subfamily serine protease